MFYRMKIALAFWGLTRSLRHTMPSIQMRILDVFKKHGIDYTIFLHTYFVNSIYSNSRAGEYGIILDNEEYRLLGADYLRRDDQDALKVALNLTAYRTHPDPWNTKYEMVDNFVLAMYSKKQLGLMIQESGCTFDYVLFLRPDVQYTVDFDVRWLDIATPKCICVPNFHRFSFKFNDRFALATTANALLYSKQFDYMLEYSKQKLLHSETMGYDYVTEILKLTVMYIPFHFNRVRANGVVRNDID